MPPIEVEGVRRDGRRPRHIGAVRSQVHMSPCQYRNEDQESTKPAGRAGTLRRCGLHRATLALAFAEEIADKAKSDRPQHRVISRLPRAWPPPRARPPPILTASRICPYSQRQAAPRSPLAAFPRGQEAKRLPARNVASLRCARPSSARVRAVERRPIERQARVVERADTASADLDGLEHSLR